MLAGHRRWFSVACALATASGCDASTPSERLGSGGDGDANGAGVGSGGYGDANAGGANVMGPSGGRDPGGNFASCEELESDACQGENCCETLLVAGGDFLMGRGSESCDDCEQGCPPDVTCSEPELPEHPAHVDDFYFDKYEVTVGRYRRFLENYAGPPEAGSGAHPVGGMGWNAAWNTGFAPSAVELRALASCDSTYETWTDEPGDNESLPFTCADWFEAFAFCVWDGGRLPSEAEWEYAAAGGDENRVYPWGDEPPDSTRAVYDCMGDEDPSCSVNDILEVGSRPAGEGKFGQQDLAGSLWEWALDWYAPYPEECDNCLHTQKETFKVLRGGYFSVYADSLRSTYRNWYGVNYHYGFVGFRCARDP
jgi:formylglycine-generating enzyme